MTAQGGTRSFLLAWAAAWLLAAPAASAADEAPAPKGEQDIYQVNRDMFGQANPGMTAEGFTTALIKKHLAMLMYPVDLGTLQTPTHDARFRAQIQLFQEKLGVPATGVLTWSQFEILQQAATTATERKVLPPSALLVHREPAVGGEMVKAQGTWLGEAGSLPLNYTEIICHQVDKACLETRIEVNVPAHVDAEHDYRLTLASRSYRVTAWNEDEVQAEAGDGCRLSINTRSKQALRSGAAGAESGCPADGPTTSARLSASAHEANRFYAARRAQALKLSYEPFRP